MSDGDETSFENWVSSTSPSSIESQSPRPSSVNSYPRSTSSYGFESDFDTQRQQTHDPPADKLDAPGSTRYVPVVHHATHRCLTPTRKINSGENHYEAYKLARQRACPPFTHSLSFFALICSLSSLVVLVPPGGVSGYDQATGNEEGEREREKVGGLHFFLRNPVSISYLSSANFTSMSSTVLSRILSKTLLVWPFTASAKRTHTLPCPRLLRYSYQ
jgi:hypothetical protein